MEKKVIWNHQKHVTKPNLKNCSGDCVSDNKIEYISCVGPSVVHNPPLIFIFVDSLATDEEENKNPNPSLPQDLIHDILSRHFVSCIFVFSCQRP